MALYRKQLIFIYFFYLFKKIEFLFFFRLWSEEFTEEVDIIKKGCRVYSLISCPSSNLLFSLDNFLNINIADTDCWLLSHYHKQCDSIALEEKKEK